jgi:hypothetical protein
MDDSDDEFEHTKLTLSFTNPDGWQSAPKVQVQGQLVHFQEF